VVDKYGNGKPFVPLVNNAYGYMYTKRDFGGLAVRNALIFGNFLLKGSEWLNDFVNAMCVLLDIEFQ
jgi:hypothetical protein